MADSVLGSQVQEAIEREKLLEGWGGRPPMSVEQADAEIAARKARIAAEEASRATEGEAEETDEDDA
ncbi:hypothetical protein ACFYYB_04345 [Streptomyces sp. NPDC002886]|uniref:hypothetical protein n=1 Tax=Streptomyces sp. NPDC002886 TaxID=3364667 RepID=UPI00368C3599